MAWTPISGIIPQFQKTDGTLADSYYIKFYSSGTTNAISMATTSDGSATLDKCQLNSAGYPTTDGLSEFIPYVDRAYKIVLYKNATDADNDTTSNADWVIDGVLQLATESPNQTIEIENQLGSQASGSVFTLTTMTYSLGINNLLVYRNGQLLRPGSSFDYTETSSTQVTLTFTPNPTDTFTFLKGTSTTSVVSDAVNVTFNPAGTGAQATNVQAKLRERVTANDFGVAVDGSSDDTAELQAALNSGASGKVLDVTLGNGTSDTSTLVLSNSYSTRLKGSGSSDNVLDFTNLDGTQCISVTNGGDIRFIRYLQDFKVEGSSTSGDGIHFNNPEVGPQMDGVWVDGCSGSGKYGVKLTTNSIGVLDNLKLFSNTVGLGLITGLGIVGRGNWFSDNTTGITIDQNSAGNDIEATKVGLTSSDSTSVAMQCDGYSNKMKFQFYENFENPRSINFQSRSYGNILEILHCDNLSVWDDGAFNKYPVNNHAQAMNRTDSFGFMGPMAGTGSLENQFYDSTWQDGATSDHFSALGATAPTISHETSIGYLDNNSLKLDWSTTALSGAESDQVWSVSAGDIISVLMMVRADRDLESDEQIAVKILGASNEDREVQYHADLRQNEWTPVFVTYKATNTENVSIAIVLDSSSTHTALVTYIDDIVFQANKKSITLLRNDQTSATRTYDRNSGLHIPKAHFERAEISAGVSGTAQVPGVLFTDTTTQATTGTAEEVLATHTLPANCLSEDGKGIRIKSWGTTAANANNKRIRVRFGGLSATVVSDTGSVSANNTTWSVEATILRTGSSSQLYLGEGVANNSVVSPLSGTDSEDLTSTVSLVVTGETPTSSGDATYSGSIVEIIN